MASGLPTLHFDRFPENFNQYALSPAVVRQSHLRAQPICFSGRRCPTIRIKRSLMLMFLKLGILIAVAITGPA